MNQKKWQILHNTFPTPAGRGNFWINRADCQDNTRSNPSPVGLTGSWQTYFINLLSGEAANIKFSKGDLRCGGEV